MTATVINLEAIANSIQEFLDNPDMVKQKGDRSVESLEIAKLNLWLNTVNLNQVLINLENNIQAEDKCTFQEVINLARTEGNLVTLK